MAKPLTLLNQDIAQAFRLHSITQPPSAFELTDLDKELLQTILATKISPRQKVEKFHNILHRYKNILEQYQDSNIQPSQPTPPPIQPPPPPPSTPIKSDENWVDEEEDEDEKEEKKKKLKPKTPKKTPKKSDSRSPKTQAILELQSILEEKDPSFDARPSRITIQGKDISDKTLKAVLESFKKTNYPLTQGEQHKVRQIIYDVAKEHPHFINVIQKLPGLKAYVNQKSTMTTRTDKASPFDARRNINLDSSVDENQEGNTFENIDINPDMTALTSSTPAKPAPKTKTKKRKSFTTKTLASKPGAPTKKGAGGIVHLKRWQKHIGVKKFLPTKRNGR
jgi:hypothetical protein